MKLRDQRGSSSLLLPFIIVLVFFLGTAGFAVWAFMSRQDYKNNVDTKISAANAVVKQQTQTTDQATYNQEAKYPLKSYVGPSAYGNVTVNYPKTWSAYVQDANNQASTGNTPINAYFQPGIVPDATNTANTFALRVQVNATSYSDTMSGFTPQVQAGQVTIAPYHLPKVPSVVGSIVTGQIEPNVNGVMIVLPLRSTTLQVWTEQPSEEADFTNIILANLTFSP
jgi:cytoskeletal protein RodZ